MPTTPSPSASQVALVVPCHDEARRLDVGAYRLHLDQNPGLLLIFVDDGSTDATGAILEDLARHFPGQVRVIRLEENRGKGEAVRRGMRAALDTGRRFVGYWDADLATPLAAVRLLGADLEAHPEALLVMGARVRLLGHHIERRRTRHVLGRAFATVAAHTLDLPVYDTQCGAKLFRVGDATREVFQEPFLTRWLFDIEILARLRRDHGLGDLRRRIREVPLPEWTDIGPSKVRPLDFVAAWRDLRRIRRAYGL